MTNKENTTSNKATVEKDDAIGRIVFQAKEITEGIPAAFTGSTTELEAKKVGLGSG